MSLSFGNKPDFRNYEQLVKIILGEMPETREKYWPLMKEVYKRKGITIPDEIYKKLELVRFESVSRASRNVKKHNKHLKGKNHKQMHNQEKLWRKDLGGGS